MKSRINNLKNSQSVYLVLYIAFYFAINLVFLDKFPLMHSDESWLSGLTRTMMNEGLGATEYFFDILPRYPHAIKSVFHILQMLFILVFGYNLFSVRLLSLICGIVTLLYIYRIIKLLTKSNPVAIWGMMIVSIDIQFIYASHFARQEIMILALMLIGMYYIISRNEWRIRNDIIVGSIIGISIGIHPNSFVTALVFGSLYIYYLFIEKKIKIKNLLILIFTTVVYAGIFVGFSFLMNSSFIHDYLKYGDNLGVTVSGIMKIFTFPDYYRKLFNGFSVTYYLPDIRLQLVIFAVAAAIGTLGGIFSRKLRKSLLLIFPLIAINTAFIIVGRYSQPYIIFIFPMCYILMVMLISKLKKIRKPLFIIIAVMVLASSATGILPYINGEYDDYLRLINSVVPEDAEVLANLNAEYAFDYGKLHDYRNLDYLEDGGFEDYIRDNDIEYIVYPEEMDFIYNNRPVWNVVYGNVYPYYDDMHVFLENECELQSTFTTSYSMRILMYSDTKNWRVKIYKVLETNDD